MCARRPGRLARRASSPSGRCQPRQPKQVGRKTGGGALEAPDTASVPIPRVDLGMMQLPSGSRMFSRSGRSHGSRGLRPGSAGGRSWCIIWPFVHRGRALAVRLSIGAVQPGVLAFPYCARAAWRGRREERRAQSVSRLRQSAGRYLSRYVPACAYVPPRARVWAGLSLPWVHALLPGWVGRWIGEVCT